MAKVSTQMKNDGGRTVMVNGYKLVIVRRTKEEANKSPRLTGQTLTGMNVYKDGVLLWSWSADLGETRGQLRARVSAYCSKM